jgi:hypothetical protein
MRQICTGAMIGLLVGAAALASGDSPNPIVAHVFDFLGTPVSLLVWLLQQLFGLSDVSAAGWWFLFHFAYWMLLGGLIGWGAAILRSKATGD